MEAAPNGAVISITGSIDHENKPLWDAPELMWQISTFPQVPAPTVITMLMLEHIGGKMKTMVQTGLSVDLPMLAAYGTNRAWRPKQISGDKIQYTSRLAGYTNCMDAASSYHTFLEWFRYWSTARLAEQVDALQQGQPYQGSEFDDFLQAVGRAVESCLPPCGWHNLHYSLKREELLASHAEHGTLPVSMLSDGIRNTLGMVADIAFRACKLNPHFGADAPRKTSGMVLIDEIELHLHPAWQQSILHSLCDAFPEMQFIVTTHSPQVLSTVPASQIRILQNHQGKISAQQPEHSSLGQEAGDALAYLMGVQPRPPLPLLDTVHAYEQYVRQGQEDSAQAQALKTALDQAGYQIAASDLAKWRFLASRSNKGG